jgi:hypothetical protein
MAAVRGDVVLGVSEDGTHVYYRDDYTAYSWQSGQTHQIGPALRGAYVRAAGASSDGREVAFTSTTAGSSEVAPGVFNTIAITEMYAYNVDTGKLTCVSCPSTGAAPTVGIETRVAASSGGTVIAEPYRPRFLSADGRYVFFNTREALLPQDTNGVTDAYEYDMVTGGLWLLSTGMGEDGAWFVEASADGHDAFLVTRQKLTRGDPDRLVDVYDVRVGGGLAEPPALGAGCDGDACQGTPSAAPGFNTASGFTGLGNPSFASTVKVKGKARPGQRLRRALAACRREPKRRRARCERLARRRYGGAGRSSARNHRAGR